MKKYLFTPFDGGRVVFETLAQACRSLKLKEQTVRNHFTRTGRAYIWDGGKLESIKNESNGD